MEKEEREEMEIEGGEEVEKEGGEEVEKEGVKSSQVKFIFIAHFIHRCNSMCFTKKQMQKERKQAKKRRKTLESKNI